MALPEKIFSNDDIKVIEEAFRNPSSPISNPWSEDPRKLAVIRAVASVCARLGQDIPLIWM